MEYISGSSSVDTREKLLEDNESLTKKPKIKISDDFFKRENDRNK